ncbi:helix-turn-helix domain-containing protein [Nocardia otitidiscaviarum]|uniref:helix-turn-helix domain-containing protein n=1 Tax=Nocardia otitidiscaviarum TaxID=1823 RepID=UPI001895FBCE|nr:helix-turn-helix domain-containing protein [Nocardia otitidiscaviarum]MBF6241440.1 helix-turn-helix domain-containing protein [Nocardia otitidiscaviarum]
MDLRQACRAAGIGVVAVSDHHGPPRPHRAVPALSARLVMSLGAPLEVRYGGRVETVQAVVAGFLRPGVATPALTLRSAQPTVYAELSPAAFQRLTGVPLSEVNAGGVDADAVLPWVRSLGRELAARPSERRAAVTRLRLLEQLSRADSVRGAEDALHTLARIGASGGSASVADLARTAHLSPRRLRVVMRQSLGITPKFASRIARLSTAVHRAATGADSWAEVAAESGYHDQSHLVHDFRDLMNTTPSGWLLEEGRNLQGWHRASS